MFLPTTVTEQSSLGWTALDIIFVTGDAYIDSPFTGVALLGKLLVSQGFRVGIIAQPDMTTGNDITRLGEPGLFWGITAGTVDSMVANYTASGKRRKSDDYTPGGINSRRPDRAVIAYTNLVKHHFRATRPIVLGGIEASLRRISHYDFWSDSIRRSILADAKADYLIYGMAEKSLTAFARALKQGQDVKAIPGLCYLSGSVPDGFVVLASHERVRDDKAAFADSFRLFYDNTDPLTSKGLAQQQDTRFLIQNPPQLPLSMAELDRLYDLDFERDLHPFHARDGQVKALDTIGFSLATHRGCYGECHFCAIAVHEGRTVQWRSRESIVREAKKFLGHPKFKGIIRDVGGPTANMYGYECSRKLKSGACKDRRCLFPGVCKNLPVDHSGQIALLDELKGLPGVRKVFVGSGIRHDLVLCDKISGMKYLETVTRDHVSGQMKVAPEHVIPAVLSLMGKPDQKSLLAFKEAFDRLSLKAGKQQFLTYYLIAAHPGCTLADMKALKRFALAELGISPEQVQIFTPTPSTWSTLMYHTGLDPFTGKTLFVERLAPAREAQKRAVTDKGLPRRQESGPGKASLKPSRDRQKRGRGLPRKSRSPQ
ncbi:MAG: YgiQ family radical SAM protein [Pseudomonadota bacterium]